MRGFRKCIAFSSAVSSTLGGSSFIGSTSSSSSSCWSHASSSSSSCFSSPSAFARSCISSPSPFAVSCFSSASAFAGSFAFISSSTVTAFSDWSTFSAVSPSFACASASAFAFISSSAFAFISASAFALISASVFLFSSSAALAILLRSFSICFRSLSALRFNSRCCFSSARFRAASALFTRNSASEASCFAFRINSCVRFLNSSEGSPMAKSATFLNGAPANRSKACCRSSWMRLPLTSMTTKFRLCTGATSCNKRRTLMSSNWGTPKAYSGLSVELRWTCRRAPLSWHQSTMTLSLISV
mmetsp:Transcript_97526/g.275892  ORF Transcript_97526/g.275892 Transcript_97526/m.275892 type:complete len:301 (-) Transcript_97526:541-1443(-)